MATNTTRKRDRDEYWRGQIAAQGNSGLTVRRFCQQQGVSEHSFYAWRNRLRTHKPEVHFALVAPVPEHATAEPVVELALASGERLRIGAGVDVATIRAVLEALQA